MKTYGLSEAFPSWFASAAYTGSVFLVFGMTLINELVASNMFAAKIDVKNNGSLIRIERSFDGILLIISSNKKTNASNKRTLCVLKSFSEMLLFA